MDVLMKIKELREQRGWSEYQLAEKSGLAQSTISSWYHKNLIPSIPSLERICEAFGITLAQFFQDDTQQPVCLSTRQRELLTAASHLNDTQYLALLAFLQAWD